MPKPTDNMTTPINIVSYGAGTQSTGMILMALNGEYGLPRPEFAVFSDTGAEPEFIYDYFDYFQN
jgi:3'-phosphoadenosine 5'-phosphosulfate sulfotransferase (PAPS reductase)/FAD synthetase